MSHNRKLQPNGHDDNLAEEILKGAGKGKDEIARVGQLDRGDDIAEEGFDPKFRTVNSPVHLAVWSGKTPVDLFRAKPTSESEVRTAYLAKMDQAIEVVKGHRESGTLFGSDNKVSDQVLGDLAKVGYWGALIAPEFGGWGAKLSDFMPFLARMAAEGDPTVAGMASIHGCIGAVDPVEAFGSDEFKKEYLPKLANGERLSAFALTEPWAGSDLTALRTKAVKVGDKFVVNGRKMFISNVLPGRTVGLVVLLQGKDMPQALVDEIRAKAGDDAALKATAEEELERWRPAVLIADLPDVENEHFQLDRYGIHAVQHLHNYGMVFTNFEVPVKNLLLPQVRVVISGGKVTTLGDGLTIAYHGLNRGRVALCANASGTMRYLLKGMLPWADFRETYGQPIGKRELVQRRVARIASLIVGADALVDWGSSLLDEGYRGELECIVAKVMGADALLESTVLALKTHGGRAFLKGHPVGDNLPDYAAPSIYEGENEVLDMALFKGLVKDHGMKFMAPFAKIKGFKPYNPVHAWKARGALTKVAFWTVSAELNRFDWQSIDGIAPELKGHAKFALKHFRRLMRQTHYAMLTYQLKLADRQQRMVELSGDVRKTVVILATALHASKKGDEATVAAADVLCRKVKSEILGTRQTDGDFKAAVKLAKLVVEGKFHQLDATASTEILRRYEKA